MLDADKGADALLRLDDVRTHHSTRQGVARSGSVSIRAVDGVSLALAPGEILGLVGESGCGKSTLARTIVGLDAITSGAVTYKGVDIAGDRRRSTAQLRREIQMVFQDPVASLDPKMRVVDIVGEGVRVKHGGRRRKARARVAELLELVGLRTDHMERFPTELSGGQRQRVGIARALSVDPQVLIADEAVSALDVSVQAQVLNLFSSLQQALDLTYIFIAHDLGVIEYTSDRIGVMYLGQLVEIGSTQDVIERPLMPYTYALLSAAPRAQLSRQRVVLGGEPPSPLDPPQGCPFSDRCWKVTDLCRRERPVLQDYENGHAAACHYPLSEGK